MTDCTLLPSLLPSGCSQTPSVCPDSSIGGLVWALQDMSQKYGDTVRDVTVYRIA